MKFKRFWTAFILTAIGSSLLLYTVVTNKSSSKEVVSYYETNNRLINITSRFPAQHNHALDTESNVNRNEQRTQLGNFVQMNDLPTPVKEESDKYIIYRCQGSCGGLADREKGVVTSYVVSQMLRRKFGILMDRKCDFSKYVIPNLVNWVVTDNLLEGKSVGLKRNVDNWALGKAMRDGNLEAMFNKEVVYYQGNVDFVNLLMNKTSFRSLPWTKNKTHHEICMIAFGHLFKLAPNTEKKYMEIYEKTSGKNLLCAHLRIGKSRTIPRDALRPLGPNSTAVIRFLQGKMSNSSKIFVATDSDEVRVQMKEAFPSQFLEVAGPIVHIDRSGDVYACSGMEKAILDQFILSRCDTLLISRSGFSRMSALVRGTDANLYIAVGNKVTNTKRLNPSIQPM